MPAPYWTPKGDRLARSHARFQKGSGVYTCRGCGKRTRETGDSESSVDLCRACFEDGGNENTHNDTHDAPVVGCRFCEGRER